MRPDQIARLREVEEKLADLFIDEADPDGWPEEGKERYQAKRAAAETAHLLARTQALQDGPAPDDKEKDADRINERRIDDAAKRAEEAVQRALKRAKGVS